VGVKDRIYILGRKGAAFVIAHGPEFRVLAKNLLDDKFYASPVIVDNQIYFRGHKYLYCISHEKDWARYIFTLIRSLVNCVTSDEE
jgi:hypothetical protein